MPKIHFSLFGLMLAVHALSAAPAMADCSAPDQFNYGQCAAAANNICAEENPTCDKTRNIGLVSTSDIVQPAVMRCCKADGRAKQRLCLQLKSATIRGVAVRLPRAFDSVRRVLSHARTELRDLLKEPDVCATVSVG